MDLSQNLHLRCVSSADLSDNDRQKLSLQNETQNNHRDKLSTRRRDATTETKYLKETSTKRCWMTPWHLRRDLKQLQRHSVGLGWTCNLILNSKASLLSSQYSPLCSQWSQDTEQEYNTKYMARSMWTAKNHSYDCPAVAALIILVSEFSDVELQWTAEFWSRSNSRGPSLVLVTGLSVYFW